MIRSRAASPSHVPSPRLRRARISVRPQTPMSAATEALIAVVAIALPSSPPPSPLTPLPHIHSPPLPLPSPPLPLPAPSSPLLLPSTDCRDDIPEADLPPRKRLCLTTPTHRFEIRESSTTTAARQAERPMSREVGYEITDTWDELVDVIQEIAPTTLEGVNQRVTELAATVSQDTHEMYVRFEDAQDDRALLRARVNMLFIDRREVHAELPAYRAQVQTHETHIQTHDARIGSHETLIATMMAQTSSLQTQLTAALGCIHTLEAKEPTRTDDLEDADSSA
ncbi:hypothetical protein Tco_0776556 [Tanacetum coccineum]